eukprot:1142766-Pelagomonas_calceolata.AAC.7
MKSVLLDAMKALLNYNQDICQPQLGTFQSQMARLNQLQDHAEVPKLHNLCKAVYKVGCKLSHVGIGQCRTALAKACLPSDTCFTAPEEDKPDAWKKVLERSHNCMAIILQGCPLACFHYQVPDEYIDRLYGQAIAPFDPSKEKDA